MISEKSKFIITVLKALNSFSDGQDGPRACPPLLSSAGQPSLRRLALLLSLPVSVLQCSELVTGLLISGLLFGEFVFPGDGPKPEAGKLPGSISGIFNFL